MVPLPRKRQYVPCCPPGSIRRSRLKGTTIPGNDGHLPDGNSVSFLSCHRVAIVGILSFFLQVSPLIRWSGLLMVVGIVIFSGTLYLLSVTGLRWLGAITPVGGTAFAVAWFLLAMACLKAVRRNV